MTRRIPEEALDLEALCGLERGFPPFLVPFQVRRAEGMVEITYRTEGRRRVLEGAHRPRSAAEDRALWEGVLMPLGTCRAWGLHPGGFVLEADALFASPDGRGVGYLYVPARRPAFEAQDFRRMALALMEAFPAADLRLENTLLRGLLAEEGPEALLRRLERAVREARPPTAESCPTEPLESARPSGAPRLRLVGSPAMPRQIAVSIRPGESFTIGRFDVTLGVPQSDFEFDRRTRAVSRRHALIGRDGRGYYLSDQGSKVGTFVDGRRLRPGVPCRLTAGCRVSFGDAGADYIWEESGWN